MQEKSPIKRNISLYLSRKGVTPYEFYKESGMTRGVLEQNNGLSESNLAKFLAYAPDVNIEWLLTGKGEMVKPEEVPSEYPNPTSLHTSKSFEKKEEIQTIPVYNIYTTAGIREQLSNAQHHVDTLRLPNMPKCDVAVFVDGDSMQPLLRTRDVILLKEYPCEEQYLIYNQIYLVHFAIGIEHYTVCKYIKKSPKGFPYIILASENPEYEDREIHFKDVKEIALVKAYIRYSGI